MLQQQQESLPLLSQTFLSLSTMHIFHLALSAKTHHELSGLLQKLSKHVSHGRNCNGKKPFLFTGPLDSGGGACFARRQ